MKMSIAAGLKLVAAIANAILEAQREGRDHVELMNSAMQLDEAARKELVAAIAEAEANSQ